jgi:hypothetical protein
LVAFLSSVPETERYIQAFCKREAEKQADSNTGKSRITKSRFIKAKRGNAGGTWLHPKLAVAFARWCDIDFALWCDEQIEALISSGRECAEGRNINQQCGENHHSGEGRDSDYLQGGVYQAGERGGCWKKVLMKTARCIIASCTVCE